jgi:3'(2'), 5'-bisphosphate nucleotidase|tara:strand:+ start:102117 stop:102908 length:792 start_codon:yes stop_codon:yes gene_type:complete
MTNETNLHTAILAAIAAGKEIMAIYSTDFDVEEKSDNSPLTIADKNANDVINTFLEKLDIPIISEENKQTPYEIRKHWSRCWIVDPLDGTKEFVKRNGEFTVNIALIENGVPILGVIYVPVTKTLYYTAADATKALRCVVVEEDNMTIEKILDASEEIKPTTHSTVALRVVGSRSHLNDETKRFIENLGQQTEIVSKGSSLKFCLVAEGNADVYPRFAPTMEWDTAAGHAICRAVGLNVTIAETKEPLQYNKENLLNPYFLVR